MRLNRVAINNFRSIKNCDVKFDPTCRVLVGINEAGKSNILNALALLSEEYKTVKANDLREPSPYGEDPIDVSCVQFVFKFEKDEPGKLFEETSAEIAADIDTCKIVSDGKTNYTLKEFCTTRDEGIFTVDILGERKSYGMWTFPKSVQLLGEWKKPSSACPPAFMFEIDKKEYQIANYKLLSAADFKEVPESYVEDATIADLAAIFMGSITKITKANAPDALLWTYEEKNVLPNSIKIADFSSNPDLCVPLKNMFYLAGYKDIKARIDGARKGSINQFQNFFDRVANQTTTHFRNVWKDYKDIEFTLKLNADQIIPSIKELNSFDFARRSDGFKRFVTFLLMISANVRSNDLRNTLVLIDEPETGLHPTGCRYLRDELIRIAKTNYVVYSTHSIFMIDPSEIERHYLVKKKDEITSIEPAVESNIAEEEVIYNALGHSIFADLKKKNIIFEGERDKKLFQVALSDSIAETKRKFKDVGICHAKGVGSIKAITPLMELAERECLIISDSDKGAKDQQKAYKRDKGYGKWNHYQEIDGEIEAITGEDFLKNDYIAKQVTPLLAGTSLPAFESLILPDNKGKLAAIRRWLTDNGYADGQANDTLFQIKDALFENLKPTHIEDSYSKLLVGITVAIG